MRIQKFRNDKYGDWYISDRGDVLVYYEGEGVHIQRQYTDSDGYKYITVRDNNKPKNLKVHRLVGYAYLELTDDKVINHIDGVKSNNKVENLEVCDHSHNMKHAVKTGLLTNCTKKGENHNTSKHTYAEVCEIRRLYKQTKISMRGLAKRFYCSSGYISDVVNNKIRVDS